MKKFSHIKAGMLAVILVFLTSLGFAQAEWQYISPQPGSKFINPNNSIALRHGDVILESSVKGDLITIIGSKQGIIEGTIIRSLDGRTLIFKTEKPFAYAETISIEVKQGVQTESGFSLPALNYSFTVQASDNTHLLNAFYQAEQKIEDEANIKEVPLPETSALNNNYKTNNNLPERFPIANITEYDSPGDGYIFCGPRPWQAAPYNPYTIILDNYGTPVFYREGIRRANDFRPIVNNQITFCDFDNANSVVNKYIVMNSWFNIIDTLTMGNGYVVDQHDMIMRENGNHFLMAYDPQIVDMDTVVPGGSPDATVIGFIVQELDPDHNVIFQWRSWDHFNITDANHTDLTSQMIDYVHGNAFDIDTDGNLLMSLRNMEEITKIDLNSGEIIWRFGLHSQNNMFTFTNDTIGFSWQHDVRRISNGNITVYDNGNYHTPQFSQAVEYQIDEENFTAELVWNYIHDPVVFGRATGANRRLANNNSFICWGLTWPINYSEVTHDGSLAWELHWSDNVWDYRAFKFDWETDLFEPAQDSVDFGTYSGYTAWPKIIPITNNSDEDIQITSTHNFLDCYQVTSELPLTIPAGETVDFHFQLFPNSEVGHLDDVLTLNYDSFFLDTLPQRISQQIVITAYVEDNNAPQADVSPEDGSVDVDRKTAIMINLNESVVYPDGSVIKSSDLQNMISFKETDINGADVEYTAYLDAWKRCISITPNAELSPGMQYFVLLPGGNLADREAHVLEDDIQTTFTTIDDAAPMVTINPADSTTGAFINTMITYTFDEAVQTAMGSEITVEDIAAFFSLQMNDEAGETVAFTGMINDEKNLITLYPEENLTAYQYYYVSLVPGTIMDMAGNVIEESYYSHFETGEELGINEPKIVQLDVSPNPTEDIVNIHFPVSGAKQVVLYNIKGAKLSSFHTDSETTNINLSNFNTGIYFINVKFEDGRTGSSRIIKK